MASLNKVMLIGNLGSVLAGAPLSAVAQSTGWRGVFIGIGALSLVLAALCWLIVRDRPEQDAAAPSAAPRFDRTVLFNSLLSVVRNRATWPAMAAVRRIRTGRATRAWPCSSC